MAITPDVLQNLAKMVDLRIEALTDPTSGGQPQVFQIRPSNLLLSTVGNPIPIPIETVLAAAIPVTIEVTWGIETEDRKTVDNDNIPLISKRAVIHAPSHDEMLVAPQKGLQATVMVLPDFVELRRDQVLTNKTLYVTAKARLFVTVTVPGSEPRVIAEKTVPLLRHPITVPAIPVPTAAILFHADHLGVSNGALASGHQFALVAVPKDSAITGISALRDACDTLRRLTATASQLVQLAGFAGVGLPSLTGLGLGLDTLLSALNLHKIKSNVGVAFVAADTVRNMNNIDLIYGTWNDIEAEDEISSLVLLGPPGRRLSLHKHRDFEGEIATITSSEHCITIVNKLSSQPPVSEPLGNADWGGTTLNNEISSIAFL